jgi:hypothetical protein
MVDGMKSTSEMYKLEETFPSFYEHRRTDRYVYFENAKPRNKKLI